MSKIHLPIAELKPALAGLGKIISRASTLPVLQNIKVDRTKDGWTTLTSTDLDHFVTVRLEQPAEGAPESILVPYEALNRITKRCGKTDSITVEKAAGDKALVEFPIGNQTAQEHVESLPPEEYPAVPRIKTDPVSIKDDIRSSLLEAFQCASSDETRVILNGAYLDVSGKQGHYVVATDGRHLYSSNSFTLPLGNSILIPDHKFLGWKEFNSDGEWQLRVQPGVKDSPGLFQISSRRWRFIARQTEGNYPNWKQVVPDSTQYNTMVELTTAAMDAILALVPKIPCHDAINLPIGLIAEGKKLTLRGRGANDSKWTNLTVDGAAVKGQPVTIYVNRDFLAKALKFGMNTIEIIDPLTPLRFSNGGKQMIVMPIRGRDPTKSPEPSTQAEEPKAGSKTPPDSEASTSTERSTMPRTTTNGISTNGHANHQVATESKPALETAAEQAEAVKTSLKTAIGGINELLDTLRQAQRDRRTSEREVQSVRTTLEKLQTVRI